MHIRSLTPILPTPLPLQACVVAVNALSAFADLAALRCSDEEALSSTSDWATVSLVWLALAAMLTPLRQLANRLAKRRARNVENRQAIKCPQDPRGNQEPRSNVIEA